MKLIKRYPNRKLYDTEAKQYITLEGIAELVRIGEEVQVIDHTTGEDLTALTLTQIIVEQEKKRSGLLPQAMLANLVRAGSEKLENLQRSLTGMGLRSTIDDEIQMRFDELVRQGETTKEEAARWQSKLTKAAEKLAGEFLPARRKDIETIFRERGIPTKEELDGLNRQLDELAKKIEAWDGATAQPGNQDSETATGS